MEAASGEQSWKPPEDEDEDVPLVGYVMLFCLFGLVCLASYVLWRLHRKRSDGLEGPAHVESTRPVRPASIHAAQPADWPRPADWKVLHMSNAHKACAAGQHSCDLTGRLAEARPKFGAACEACSGSESS